MVWETWAKVGIVAGAACVCAVAFFYIYVFLSKKADEPLELEFHPSHESLVQQRMEMLEWPDDGSPEWEVRVHDSTGSILWFARVGKPWVRLPYELLSPSNRYGWSVQGLGRELKASDEAHVRWFRTADEREFETPHGTISVFPSVIEVTPRNMVGEIVLEVRHLGKFEVRLPSELVFSDGSKVFETSGPVLLHMRFDFAHAPRRIQDWGPVEIRTAGSSVLVPVSGGDPVVSYREGVDTGFDPYLDTPSFSNFSSTSFSELTKGTCLGIILAVKLFFESVEFGTENGIPVDDLFLPQLLEAMASSRRLVVASSSNFREMSEKEPHKVMELSEVLHLENLNPLNIPPMVRAVLFPRDEERLMSWIWRELARGSLPVVAGFRLKLKLLKTGGKVNSFAVLDSGHAMLVYRGWRFGEETVFAVYDPNYEYRPNDPLRTALWIRPGRGVTYHFGGKPDRLMVRFIPVASSRGFALTSLMLQRIKEWFVHTQEVFWDVVQGR